MPQVVITKPAFLAWLQVRLNMFVKGWDVVSFFLGFGELLLVTTCAKRPGQRFHLSAERSRYRDSKSSG